MKYKAHILNEVNGKEYSGVFYSEADREEYVQRVINKTAIGLRERQVLKSELPENLISRVISEVTKSVTMTSFDELSGMEVEQIVDVVFCNVKSDFLVTLTDENNYQELREKEYPSIQEIIHIILDDGMNSVEFDNLQALRQIIKVKYPKS